MGEEEEYKVISTFQHNDTTYLESMWFTREELEEDGIDVDKRIEQDYIKKIN